jgi:hypothetical protein
LIYPVCAFIRQYANSNQTFPSDMVSGGFGCSFLVI